MKLTVEFLGLYGAAAVGERATVEWPPHPDRLYQAMVDAAEPGDRAALVWIEEQEPPGVDCGSAVPLEWGRKGKTYVPTNYPTDTLPGLRKNQERQFPMAVPDGPVRYVWADDPPPHVFEAISRTVSRITHLGRSDSLVMAAVEPGSWFCRWAVHDRGPIAMRVPHRGRFEQLEAAFARGQRSPLAPPVKYGDRSARALAGPWAELIIVRLTKPIAVEHMTQATDSLRRAVLSKLGDHAPLLAHGHAPAMHMAWLGLPNLSTYGDGTMLGLAMAVPRECDAIDRAQCVGALLSINHIMLAGMRFNVTPPTTAISLHEKTWTRPATRWVSVSPVVLDRFPKGKLSAEEIVAQGCERAGYPRPKRVELSQDSALPIPAARRFRLRRPGGLYAHAVIEFDRPVHGPLLVGKERYFGMGLFLPADARTTSFRDMPEGFAPRDARDNQ